MNKTVSVNISGFIFNIEEIAYEKLSRYLNTIRGYFSESTGAEEIIEDIEARIAELFQEKISNTYQVIKLKDVNEVIAVMGEPEEYIDGEAEEYAEEEKSTGATSNRKNKYRKIYRDPDDKVLGGVCSGIGYYFGIDPIWIRLLFVILLIGFGTGVLFYIILWIIIPKANSASEKLEMKGDPVTAENIGKQVEEEINNLKKKFTKKDGVDSKSESHIARGLGNFFTFLGKLLGLLLNSIGKVLGFLFVFIGVGVLVSLLFGIGTSGELITNLSFVGNKHINFSEFLYLFPEGMENLGWIKFFLILTLGIPFLALILLGFNMLTNFVYKVRGLGIALFLVWFIVSIGSVFFVGSIVRDYADEYDEKSTVVLDKITSDTLMIEVMNDDIFYADNSKGFNNLDFIKITDDKIYIGNPELDIQKSKTDEFQLVIYVESRGKNRLDARSHAQTVEYDYMAMGNLISFAPYFTVPKEQGYHFEDMKLRLLVPEGKAIYLQDGSERIIYDIDNVTNTWDWDMINKVWTMTERGLECIDCDPQDL
jgi:phage shock protein PspC (stress-responsive transcriptional regulator)